jgi:phosphoserine aminotransferase
MARYLKNTQLKGGSYAIQLPLGTSSLGPAAPQNGQIRWNQTNNRVEYYYSGAWRQFAKVGAVNITVDEFTGDNTQTNFVMSQSESSANNILVTISGVYQAPTNNYTVSGTTLTFTSPPPAVDASGNPNKIIVVHNLNSTDAA